MRLQFDNKINPFPETSRLTLTGDAPSVAIAKKSLVVLYRETNVRQFLLGVLSKRNCLTTTLAHRTRKFES
ncbi:hypothetical protein [Nostoc sp.]|uniref:hypothetical protein n=1 Tax=Nostoc sp. TaxID=1180 RepID=UPI002FF6F999